MCANLQIPYHHIQVSYWYWKLSDPFRRRVVPSRLKCELSSRTLSGDILYQAELNVNFHQGLCDVKQGSAHVFHSKTTVVSPVIFNTVKSYNVWAMVTFPLVREIPVEWVCVTCALSLSLSFNHYSWGTQDTQISFFRFHFKKINKYSKH